MEEDILIFNTKKEAYNYLKQYAKVNKIKHYDIVEDNYEVKNGLLFFEYDKQGNEISHYPLVSYLAK